MATDSLDKYRWLRSYASVLLFARAHSAEGTLPPWPLVDELDLEDLESLVVTADPDSVRLRRQRCGIIVARKADSANSLADGGDPPVVKAPANEYEFVPGYITIDSELTDETPVTKGAEVESLEVLKEKESRLLAQEHVMTFSQRHKGWIYRVPRESGKYMVQRLEALLE